MLVVLLSIVTTVMICALGESFLFALSVSFMGWGMIAGIAPFDFWQRDYDEVVLSISFCVLGGWVFSLSDPVNTIPFLQYISFLFIILMAAGAAVCKPVGPVTERYNVFWKRFLASIPVIGIVAGVAIVCFDKRPVESC